MALAEQALGSQRMSRGLFGPASQLAQRRLAGRLGCGIVADHAELLARLAQTGVHLAQLLLELAGPRRRGCVAADVEGQRPQLASQPPQALLQLRLAARKPSDADRDPLLVAAQLRQQPQAGYARGRARRSAPRTSLRRLLTSGQFAPRASASPARRFAARARPPRHGRRRSGAPRRAGGHAARAPHARAAAWVSAAWACCFSGRRRAACLTLDVERPVEVLDRAVAASAERGGGACGACRGQRPPRSAAGARAAWSGRSPPPCPG